jgi:ABC-2 type transport system ATP-binding protein
MAGPALAVDGVDKRYAQVRALEGVDLTVEEGEIFALLGPNGAGKTTLIHCVAGLARITAGQIRVFGHDVVSDYRTTRRLVGLVPQEIYFDPFFTPFESLMIQMGLMGVRPDAARAEALLSTFALADKRDAYTRSLSGGMKRRLLIAEALVHRPKLLFLDEPTAGVDVELRRELWNEVRRLRDEGTTIILTTHFLEEAEQLADRVGIIHRGRILLVEERERLLGRYGRSHLRVALARPADSLPAGLPDGSVLETPNSLVVPWAQPEELAAALGAITAHDALEVRDVSVGRATLEEVFVDLIAEANRDESSGADR